VYFDSYFDINSLVYLCTICKKEHIITKKQDCKEIFQPTNDFWI